MKISGTTYRFTDNINTDAIISGRYKFSISDIKELAKHVMEDIDPDFANKIKPKETIIVAGDNFGMGSSREQAPLALKTAGIAAIVAKSFARIFYRNSFNIGLPLIEADTTNIAQDDKLAIDLDSGILQDITKQTKLKINPFPSFIQQLILDGGIVNHFKKHKKINL